MDTSHLPSARHWERVGTRPRSGLAVPLFSLRSERSAGVGDFADLERLADWCAAIGASVIQLLPLNDLGPDSAPYGAVSAFALDPIYAAPDRISAVQADPALRAKAAALAADLEQPGPVAYDRVRGARMAFLEAVFATVADALRDDTDFEAFVAEHERWLEDYVLYRTLREHHGWRSWEDWGDTYDMASLARFSAEHASRLQFHRWIQWILDGQLRAAHQYANERGVLLKGDIPILVGRDSADVWRNPHLFFLDTSAGAPPDYYAEDGQNWGFPTYDWEAHWPDGCQWWRARLAHASRYFDLYRVDHVVGLFRIWTIRHGEETGRNGWFVPEEEWRWGGHGRGILEMMLDATDMLPLAEDLGTIPDVCRDTLRDLGICGTKVVRWERRWHGDGSFIPPSEFAPLSMATLSTHDSDTLRGWWQDSPEERQLYWETLGGTGEAPSEIPRDVHLEALGQVTRAGSLFVILLPQDILAPFGRLEGSPADNRINVPGTVADTNWSWRLPCTLDALVADDDLNERLKAILRR